MKTELNQDRQDSVIRILSPKVAAEKLGWTVEQVLDRRAKLGLGEFVGRTNRHPGTNTKSP